jgi:hypothetical protein
LSVPPVRSNGGKQSIPDASFRRTFQIPVITSMRLITQKSITTVVVVAYLKVEAHDFYLFI